MSGSDERVLIAQGQWCFGHRAADELEQRLLAALDRGPVATRS